MILRKVIGEELWQTESHPHGAFSVTLTLECSHVIERRKASAYRGRRARCYTCEALAPLVRASMMNDDGRKDT